MRRLVCGLMVSVVVLATLPASAQLSPPEASGTGEFRDPGVLLPKIDVPRPTLERPKSGAAQAPAVRGELPEVGLVPLNESINSLTREIIRIDGDLPTPLTVVWLCDETRSMQEERREVAERTRNCLRDLETVFRERAAAGKKFGLSNRSKPGHLVAGFGRSNHFALKRPTTNAAEVLEAIEQLPVDGSGIENTVHAIRDAVVDGSRLAPEGSRLLVVVFTDEMGNDGIFLENAVAAVQRHRAPVIVIGYQAVFGASRVRLKGNPNAADASLPIIQRGPESADFEVLTWDIFPGPEREQPSGFGPYQLNRLAKQSGGIYFQFYRGEDSRLYRWEKLYSIVALRDYQPELESREVYIERRERSLLRRTVYEAIQETRDFTLPLHFPDESRPMIECLREAADKAERQLNQLIPLESRLRSLRLERAKETSKRWRANYDLAVAQIVASQVTLQEYRAALLRAAIDPDRELAGVAWDIEPGKDRHSPSDETDDAYAEAERLLRVVARRHPGTPWADRAVALLNRGLSVACRPVDSPKVNGAIAIPSDGLYY